MLDIGEGREKEASISLCKRALGETTSSVRVLTSDMWRGDLALHEALLSHARWIHDRFHLVQALTKSQDKVRRGEVKYSLEILKNRRYVLLKSEENLRRESYGKAGRTLSEYSKSELGSQRRLTLTSRIQRSLWMQSLRRGQATASALDKEGKGIRGARSDRGRREI